MFKKFKNQIILVVASLTMLAPGFAFGVASATTNSIANNVCQGANDVAGGTSDQCTGTTNINISTIATKLINIISIIVGIVAVIMIVFGGFKYITSGGDSGNVTSAKNTLLYAIIGLIVVALAQFIVHFVLSTANSATS
jgi:hypothetical protein